MANTFSAMLLVGALALSGFLIVDGIRTLWLREPAPRTASPPPAKPEPERASAPPSPVFATKPEHAQVDTPEPRVTTTRSVSEQVANADVAMLAAEPSALAWCEDGVRISGNAYVRPGVGGTLVMFSGPDVRRRGLRSVGGRVAGKTVAAIYPQAVVLRDTEGRECWLKMSSAHARDVVADERRLNARRTRDEQRERTAARRAAKTRSR